MQWVVVTIRGGITGNMEKNMISWEIGRNAEAERGKIWGVNRSIK